jgi:hypothetical protein
MSAGPMRDFVSNPGANATGATPAQWLIPLRKPHRETA